MTEKTNEPYYLFLDDIRDPEVTTDYLFPAQIRPIYKALKWTVVKNYDEFVEILRERGLPAMVSFDHDLADEHYAVGNSQEGWEEYHTDESREKTGYDCAKYLVEFCQEKGLKLPEFLVHSMNIVGREKIMNYLQSFKKSQNETRD